MKKLVLLTMIVFMAIPCFAGSPFNIWTKPNADWLTGQTPNFDPAWAWMKWMDGLAGTSGGTAYYVDCVNGLATNDGLTWDRALLTIQAAVDLVDDYDLIYVRSTATITETVTTSDDMGVKLIGVSNGKTNPNWTSTGTGTNCLILNGPCWEVKNFLWSGAGRTVEFVHVAYAANGTVISNCYFHGGSTSSQAICYYGAPPQCKLYYNHFTAFGGDTPNYDAAVSGGYGVMSANDYEIIGNWFSENTDHLRLQAGNCLIKNNSFQSTGSTSATVILDTVCAGASCGYNIITGNTFGDKTYEIDNANGYYGSTTDVWSGNICPDGITIETYPRAGTTLIEQDSITPKIYLTSTITSAMATNYDQTDSPVTIFTVTGDILCRACAIVKTSVTSDSDLGKLALGISGTTACLIPEDVIEGAGHWEAGDVATLTIPATINNAVWLPDDWIIIAGGADIILTVTTQDMAAGVVMFNLEWKPLSADAEVVGAAP